MRAWEIGERQGSVDSVRPGDRVMASFFTGWLDGPLQPSHFGTDLGGSCGGTLAEFALIWKNLHLKGVSGGQPAKPGRDDEGDPRGTGCAR